MREAAQAELVQRGRDPREEDRVRAFLGDALTSEDPEVALRARHALTSLGRERERSIFEAFVAGRGSLEDALLLIARAVDPAADVAGAREVLRAHGETLRARIGGEPDPRRILRRVTDYHFRILELEPFQLREPREQILTHQLAAGEATERRLIDFEALASLVQVVAERAGVELQRARTRQAILLAYDPGDGAEPLWIDLQQRGRALDAGEVRQLLESDLRYEFDPRSLAPLDRVASIERTLSRLHDACEFRGAIEARDRLGGLIQELRRAQTPSGETDNPSGEESGR